MMPDGLLFLLSILATYRVSHMLALEDGPFDIFTRFRWRVGQHNWIGRGLNCTLCISFWLSLAPALLIFSGIWFLAWLAIAGGVVFIHLVSER